MCASYGKYNLSLKSIPEVGDGGVAPSMWDYSLIGWRGKWDYICLFCWQLCDAVLEMVQYEQNPAEISCPVIPFPVSLDWHTLLSLLNRVRSCGWCMSGRCVGIRRSWTQAPHGGSWTSRPPAPSRSSRSRRNVWYGTQTENDWRRCPDHLTQFIYMYI